MKHIFFLTILITALLLSGCSSDEPISSVEEAPIEAVSSTDRLPSSDEDSSETSTTPGSLESYLSTDYENATSPYIQLSLGTLKLAETDQLITVEQAQSLLLLWQASKSLESNANMAPQEIAAVQAQIVATMTPAQLEAIANMQLTNDDLAAFYESQGLSMPNPDEESEGQRGGGMGGSSDLSTEEREAMRATRQASESGGEGGGAGRERKTILTDTVVNYLSAIISNGG